MPTIVRDGPYRFFFYASDSSEPPHIHVERDRKVAKFWLSPLRLSNRGDFSQLEARRIEELVAGYREKLMEAWHEFFG